MSRINRWIMVSMLTLIVFWPSLLLAQPVITDVDINVYNVIHGTGEGYISKISYRFEVSISVIGNISDIKAEDIRLTVNDENVLDISDIEKYEKTDDNPYDIAASGTFEKKPILEEYSVTIKDADGQTSAPFVIGLLEDYPKDAPEIFFPEHGQVIVETQPTFRWEEFKSVYRVVPVDSSGYQIDLTFPNGDIFAAYTIPGDQITLDYDNIYWNPSQPPSMLPGIYVLTIHSGHRVAYGFNFEHHRTIEFTVRVCTPGDTQSCDTGLSGICADGTQTCVGSGYWGECVVQDNQTSAEICDGLDNDCDSEIDEDLPNNVHKMGM